MCVTCTRARYHPHMACSPELTLWTSRPVKQAFWSRFWTIPDVTTLTGAI